MINFGDYLICPEEHLVLLHHHERSKREGGTVTGIYCPSCDAIYNLLKMRSVPEGFEKEEVRYSS